MCNVFVCGCVCVCACVSTCVSVCVHVCACEDGKCFLLYSALCFGLINISIVIALSLSDCVLLLYAELSQCQTSTGRSSNYFFFVTTLPCMEIGMVVIPVGRRD